MGLLIGQPQMVAGPNEIKALLAVLFSICVWALGMTLNPRLDMGKNNFRSTAMQMLIGGALAMSYSLLVGEWNGWSVEAISLKSIFSLSYLIVFGAIGAFSALNFLMKTVSPEKAATGTYVNPVVAMFLGAMLNDEAVSIQSVIAGAILITGVYFINSSRSKAVVQD
jgi:drug/metabolite transporter (DMT)-like permease